MPHERYFFPGKLSKGEQITLDEAEHRHLSNVMRGKPGDQIELINGQGVLATGTITEILKKQSKIRIDTLATEENSPHSPILAQAIPRINQLDLIIEKVTELGVQEIWLFPGDRSDRKEISEHQLERLRAITIAAIKQSGRLWLPPIKLLPSLKNWKEFPHPSLFGDVSPTAPHLNTLSKEHYTLFIGPESGFSENEIKLLKERKAQGVKLHRNILRAETAAIAGITLLTQD